MKLAVCTPTRGRPLALIGVIMALWRQRAGKDDLRFVVGIDDDDDASLDACKRLGDEVPIYASRAPRSTLGDVSNRIVGCAKDADAVIWATDRAFVITPGWDEIIAEAVDKFPKRILWWSCPYDADCVMPIIPKQWAEAADHELSPTIFPFWFNDTWLQELDLMVSGGPSLKVQAAYAGQRSVTTRGRDFGFWYKVFAATRAERWAKAETIAERLGIEVTMREFLTQHFAKYDAHGQANAPAFQKRFGDPREPGAEYIAAKAYAEKLLQDKAA